MPLCKIILESTNNTQDIGFNNKTNKIMDRSSIILDTLIGNITANNDKPPLHQPNSDTAMDFQDPYLTSDLTSERPNDLDPDLSTDPETAWIITEFQLIKAIVLVVVLSLVLLSTCKLIFKSFARNVDGKES